MSLVRKCDFCNRVCEEEAYLFSIIKYPSPSKIIDDSKMSGNDICKYCHSEIMGTIVRIKKRQRDKELGENYNV